MTARRFRLEMAGVTAHGLAFDSEQELDDFLAARSITIAEPFVTRPAIVSTAPPLAIESSPRPRGRPSVNAVIAEAVRALGQRLASSKSDAARARLVQQHIAKACADPSAI